MNSRFFDVKKSKQDSIINAALKIFSQNGYKKASTDVIVKEAGISKGLLFHYFISKKGLYEFICDYSVKYMTLELTRAVKKSENDFFKVQVQIERARTRVMKNYPYMQQFLNNMKFETDKDAVEAIGDKCGIMAETYNSIYCQTDNTKFLDKIDVNRIIDMLAWMSDGFIRDRFQNPNPDMDAMSEEFERYLNMLRRHFYKSPGDDMISIAREEMVGRDDTIMDQMKMDATFEARLEAGKQSQFEVFEEPEKKDLAEEVTETAIYTAEAVISDVSLNAESINEEKIEAYSESVSETISETASQADELSDTIVPEHVDDISANATETISEEYSADVEGEVTEENEVIEEAAAFPSWWTQPEDRNSTVAVTSSNVSMPTLQETYSEVFLDEDKYAQSKVYVEPDTNTLHETYVVTDIYGNSDEGVETNAYIQQPIMAEIPVPADILHTTAVNNDDDDDDEPWTPRPVRQIRL